MLTKPAELNYQHPAHNYTFSKVVEFITRAYIKTWHWKPIEHWRDFDMRIIVRESELGFDTVSAVDAKR